MKKIFLAQKTRLHLSNQSAGVNTYETGPSTPRGLLGERSVVLFSVLCVLFIMPNISNANIKISEIMYDPDGTDGGREWVEILNDVESPIDLTKYKFFENNTKHGISSYRGTSATIGAGEYGVIADDPAKFLLDYPSFTGKLFDSTFSLNNTGESLSLLDSTSVVIDSISYIPPVSPSFVGGSLSLVSGSWVYTPATPGAENTENASVADGEPIDSTSSVETVSETTSTISAHSDPAPVSTYKPAVSAIKISAGRKRLATIFQPIEFQVFSNTNKEHFKTEWSFGDGSKEIGRKAEHTYFFPGEYEVVAKSGSLALGNSVSRTKVKIIEPKIKIEPFFSGNNTENGVKISNLSDSEINLKDFSLVSGRVGFVFDTDTIIGANKQVIFPEQILKIGLFATSTTFSKRLILQYPNGENLIEFAGSL